METQPTPVADFATFMHAYQDMVFTTCARITGNDAQAQDISQDVFLKAYAHFEQLQASNTAGGWLKTVATRLSINHLNRYRRRWRMFSELRTPWSGDAEHAGETDTAPEAQFPSADTAAVTLDAQTRHALIEQALRDLPEHQRVPLVLFHFEELPYQQIAEQLNVSLPKVKTDIQRGRAALVSLLAKRGLGPEMMELDS